MGFGTPLSKSILIRKTAASLVPRSFHSFDPRFEGEDWTLELRMRTPLCLKLMSGAIAEIV